MEDLINKYFEKNLTGNDLDEFEKKLNTDSQFKEEFEFQKSLQSAIHLRERTELKKLVESFEKPRQQVNWWKYAAAAVVIFIGGWIVFQQFFNRSNSSELYLSYYQTFPNIIAPNVRGESQESIKNKAFMAYDKGEFEISAKYFENLKTQTSEDYPTFYEGICYLELNKPEKTIALFENKKFDDNSSTFKEYKQWYLALAYLKIGKIDLAKELLSKLSDSKFELNKQASSLLKEL